MNKYKIRSRILAGAANIIEKNGWCQHQSFDGDKCCALGAMGKFINAYYQEDIYLDYCAERNQITNYIVNWNDDPNQTKENVIFVLRAAAKKYLEKSNHFHLINGDD